MAKKKEQKHIPVVTKKSLEFFEKYNINIGVTVKMLHYGHPGSEGHEGKLAAIFVNGDFKVKFLPEATQLAEQCKLFEQFDAWRDRGFIIAIHKIIKAGLLPLVDIVAAF